MDDKVTAGLADGWEDALYFLGWGGGGGELWSYKVWPVYAVYKLEPGA